MKNSNIRVDKLLSSLGYGTRKYVAGMVKQGLVVFDGHPMTDVDWNFIGNLLGADMESEEE